MTVTKTFILIHGVGLVKWVPYVLGVCLLILVLLSVSVVISYMPLRVIRVVLFQFSFIDRPPLFLFFNAHLFLSKEVLAMVNSENLGTLQVGEESVL